MRKISDAVIEGHRKTALACMKRVYCYETDTVYESLNAASIETGAQTAAISRCCKGTQRVANNCHFCYEQDIDQLCDRIEAIRSREHTYKPIAAIRIDTGEKLIFPSRQAASQKLQIPDSTISSIVAGGFKQSRGWTFEDMSNDVGYLFS